MPIETINFNDPAFEKAVRNALNIPNERLTTADLESISGIMIRCEEYGKVIVPWYYAMFDPNKVEIKLIFNVMRSTNDKWVLDLVDKFTHIKSLHLKHSLDNLNFIAQLKKLQELYIYYSDAANWSFLSELVDLKHFFAERCPNFDIVPLGILGNKQTALYEACEVKERFVLPTLEHLSLRYCNISDISPLGHNEALSEIELSHNNIEDISALSSLRSLYYLELRWNRIKDLSPLVGKDLQIADIRHNEVSDLNLFKGSSTLFYKFYCSYNPIKDFSVLWDLVVANTDIPKDLIEK